MPSADKPKRPARWRWKYALIGVALLIAASLPLLEFLTVFSLVVSVVGSAVVGVLVGAVAFPVAPVLWHFLAERRRPRDSSSNLRPRDRLLLRVFGPCLVILGVVFGLFRPTAVDAIREHGLWFWPWANSSGQSVSPSAAPHLRLVPSSAKAVMVWKYSDSGSEQLEQVAGWIAMMAGSMTGQKQRGRPLIWAIVPTEPFCYFGVIHGSRSWVEDQPTVKSESYKGRDYFSDQAGDFTGTFVDEQTFVATCNAVREETRRAIDDPKLDNLHPTLRGLWNEVESDAVFVMLVHDLPDRSIHLNQGSVRVGGSDNRGYVRLSAAFDSPESARRFAAYLTSLRDSAQTWLEEEDSNVALSILAGATIEQSGMTVTASITLTGDEAMRALIETPKLVDKLKTVPWK